MPRAYRCFKSQLNQGLYNQRTNKTIKNIKKLKHLDIKILIVVKNKTIFIVQPNNLLNKFN